MLLEHVAGGVGALALIALVAKIWQVHAQTRLLVRQMDALLRKNGIDPRVGPTPFEDD